jgi:HPt (histidine-containing phosphotransfer) domain-containing protein
MAQAAMLTAATGEPPAIDRAHLKLMTFGDRSLERELLRLFDRQAEVLIARMRQSETSVLAALAHTLKGSAVSVGANEVARTAAAVELAASASSAARAAAFESLARAIATTRAEIAVLLQA